MLTNFEDSTSKKTLYKTYISSINLLTSGHNKGHVYLNLQLLATGLSMYDLSLQGIKELSKKQLYILGNTCTLSHRKAKNYTEKRYKNLVMLSFTLYASVYS